ncbi:MAG TPA: hypothetical protein VD815_09795 [Candidatus Saccharimonadales bacterium]|nr:hypothetical protein [Candidatus Saccharimonadales bacterium]
MTNKIINPKSSDEYAIVLKRLRHSFDRAANMKRQNSIGISDNNNSVITDEFGLDAEEDSELIAIITQVRKEQIRLVKTLDSEYEKVAVETFGVWDKILSTYIPELCEALYLKQPKLKEEEIKRRIIDELIDIYPGIMNDRHLQAWTIQN